MWSRENRMRHWLETRENLYSQLQIEDRTPLQLPTGVITYLYTKIGTSNQYLEHTPYPTWIPENLINIQELRGFLTNYSLSAYWGQSYWINTGWTDAIVITPQVPIEVREILNKLFGVDYQEDNFTPCLKWRIDLGSESNLSEEKMKNLLEQVRLKVRSFSVIPHLNRIWDQADQTSYFYNCIAIAPTEDKYDLIRFYDINGDNYGLGHENIIKELMLLDKQYGIDFVGPAEVQLRRIPEGKEFQQLLTWYENFCPNAEWDPDKIVTKLKQGQIVLGWD